MIEPVNTIGSFAHGLFRATELCGTTGLAYDVFHVNCIFLPGLPMRRLYFDEWRVATCYPSGSVEIEVDRLYRALKLPPDAAQDNGQDDCGAEEEQGEELR